MTTPCYQTGCAAGSEVSGIAPAPAVYAWCVNLDNGNSNRNHQTNHNRVRAVRAGECQPRISFSDLYPAWRDVRRGKKPSQDQQSFEESLLDGLLALERRLNAGTWTPTAPTCFIQIAPKLREIHAPAFSDRVVHRLLVNELEAIYQPIFIHDNCSNQIGKGTHFAVRRLRSFVRQIHSGQGGGYYLQLDVANYFLSIDRRILYGLLKPRMERAGLSEPVRRAAHALLNNPVSRTGVRWACTEAEREAVPPHKRLANAAAGCGIAIGNLSSQFFANVYLHELDLFVKHVLRARRYIRYVDDFVIVHHDRAQLLEWEERIQRFLADRLHLKLKSDRKLRPLKDGVDFLGYVVFPTHTAVRRRVVAHARTKLAAWERRHVDGSRITKDRAALDHLRSLLSSYAGHLRHADARGLLTALYRRFWWLAPVLEVGDE